MELVPTSSKGRQSSANVVCIFRDETTIDWKSNRIVQSLEDDTTMVKLYKIVAEKANYIKDTFLLAFLKASPDSQTDEEIILDDKCDTTIREVIGSNDSKKQNFLIKAKDGKDPIKHIQEATVYLCLYFTPCLNKKIFSAPSLHCRGYPVPVFSY